MTWKEKRRMEPVEERVQQLQPASDTHTRGRGAEAHGGCGPLLGAHPLIHEIIFRDKDSERRSLLLRVSGCGREGRQCGRHNHCRLHPQSD
jgi:hypothetical protein